MPASKWRRDAHSGQFRDQRQQNTCHLCAALKGRPSPDSLLASIQRQVPVRRVADFYVGIE